MLSPAVADAVTAVVEAGHHVVIATGRAIVATTHRGFILRCDEVAGPETLKPGDGIVFDEGRPETDEAHGQIYKVEPWRNGATKQISSALKLAPPGSLIHIELGNRDARPGEQPLPAA